MDKGVCIMKNFEVGRKYYGRSVCNYDCIFEIEVIRRTGKTITFLDGDEQRVKKIRTDNNGEYVILGNYSMAPVIRAIREA